MDEEVVPVLRVEDAGRAVDWYARLGFHKEIEDPDGNRLRIATPR